MSNQDKVLVSQDSEPAKKGVTNLLEPFLAKAIGRFQGFIVVPQQVFLVLGLIFGLAFLIILPPGQVPDEYVHFYRAYQISDGELIVHSPVSPVNKVGGFIPVNVQRVATVTQSLAFHTERKIRVEQLTDLLKLPLNSNEKLFTGFPNVALYPPIPYISAAIGINLGKIFNLSPLILWYLARLGNLLSYLGLIYLAIKIIPVFKWAFLLMSLTPMALSQAASVSEDCLTNGLALFFIALIFYYTFTYREPFSRKQLALLLVMGVLVTLTKPSFFPLLVLYTLLPVSRFGTIKRYLGLITAMLFISATTLIAWNQLLTLAVGKITLDTVELNLSPGDQLAYMVRVPLRSIDSLWSSFTYQTISNLEEYIGKLGWLDTPLSPLLILSYALFLTFIGLVDNNPAISINYLAKLKIGVAMLGCLGATIFLLYLSWTPVGSYQYEGMQGRYLIPIVPLFALLFYNRAIVFKVKAVQKGLLVGCFSFVVLSLTLSTVIDRYYADALIPGQESIGSGQGLPVGEILPTRPFKETFICPVNKLDDLALYVATYVRTNTSQFSLTLLDSNNNQLEQQFFDAVKTKDNSWVFFKLTKSVENCYGKSFTLTLNSPNATPGNAITTMLFPRINEGSYQPVYTYREANNRVLGLAFNSYNRKELLFPRNY